MEYAPISALIEDPSNARKHSKKNLDAIKGSLAKFGQQKPIVVSSDNIVIAGNGTLAAAKTLGWDQIGIIRSKLTGIEAIAYAIADNRTGELAEWDNDVLSKTLEGLKIEDFDLGSIGFDDKDLERLLKEHGNSGLTADDEIPDKVETRCKVGDLWILGGHKLLCGDSTDTLSVQKLMNNEKADMVFTDPPYNVAYVGKTKDALKIQNDKMDEGKFIQFLSDAFSNMSSSMKRGGSFYIAHADTFGLHFRQAVKNAGMTLKQCLVWVKDSMVMGRQDYHWQHEPILYGWIEGHAHSWHTDRKQTTVLNFPRPKRSEEHPTMKPVALVEYLISNSSKKDDLILDAFLGSGTTLIASERLERRCFGLEIDPHYCDVILTRWEKFTGKEAKLT